MNRRLRFLLLLLISYAGAQSLLRLILFFTSWRETSLLPMDLLGTFALGILYDIAGRYFFLSADSPVAVAFTHPVVKSKIGTGVPFVFGFCRQFCHGFYDGCPVPVLAGVPYEFQFYRGRLSGLYSGNAGHDPGVL